MVGEECHCDDLAGDEAEDGGVKEDESMEEVGEPLTEEEGARMKRELVRSFKPPSQKPWMILTSSRPSPTSPWRLL